MGKVGKPKGASASARRETRDARRGDGVVLFVSDAVRRGVCEKEKKGQTNERARREEGMKEGRRLQKERGEGRKERRKEALEVLARRKTKL